MSIKLRACVETDIPSITAIYAHAVTHGTASFELVAPDQAEMSRRRAALIDADYPYLVAEREDAVRRLRVCGPVSPPACLSLDSRGLDLRGAEAQGSGIGELLLARLIAEAEARDFRLMVAVIGDGNRAAPSRFTEATGSTSPEPCRGSATSMVAGCRPC